MFQILSEFRFVQSCFVFLKELVLKGLKMLLTSGRMIVGRDPPSHFVVADSVFELDIKDVKEFQGGNEIVSDKIRLMELSDASW